MAERPINMFQELYNRPKGQQKPPTNLITVTNNMSLLTATGVSRAITKTAHFSALKLEKEQ